MDFGAKAFTRSSPKHFPDADIEWLVWPVDMGTHEIYASATFGLFVLIKINVQTVLWIQVIIWLSILKATGDSWASLDREIIFSFQSMAHL